MSSQTADPFCPIYREAQQAVPWKKATSAHAGLLFDKFADAWWHDREWTFAFDKGDRSKKDRDKADHEKEGHWLKSVFPKAYASSATLDGAINLGSLLDEACARQRRLVERLGGRILSLTNTERFVTGMGREHPLENGFAWHHTLGVPYLPGSSVKGLLRAWLRDEHGQIITRRGEPGWRETLEVEQQFGTQGQVGRVILLDMLPTTPPQLDVDVMTPHYGDYYQKGETPGDWHSPNPISFLTVAPNQKWQVGIIPGQGAGSLNESTLNSLTEALVAALQFNGGGAKTAVGYGRFEPDLDAQHAREVAAAEELANREAAAQQARDAAAFNESLAGVSDELKRLKTLQRDQAWTANAGNTTMTTALHRFADENPSPPQDCLDWIRSWLESIAGYKGVWTEPEAKQGKRQKPKFNSEVIRDLVKKLNPPQNT